MDSVRQHSKCEKLLWASSNHDLEHALNNSDVEYDVAMFAGWSTPPDEWTTKKILMVTEHPATSDRYTPGSPLQNQILDGIRYTKHRIVRMGYPELDPHLWSHQVNMDLTGNMSYILNQMEWTSKHLFNMFMDDFPNIEWKNWPTVTPDMHMKRRTPGDSVLSKEQLSKMTSQQLFDFIRCLEDPYPNACFEDEHGVVYFNKATFKAK
jgi:hypothetical protein